MTSADARLLPGFFALFTEAMTAPRRDLRGGPTARAPRCGPRPDGAPVDEEHADEFDQRLERAAGADGERFLELAGMVDEHHPHGSY